MLVARGDKSCYLKPNVSGAGVGLEETFTGVKFIRTIHLGAG